MGALEELFSLRGQTAIVTGASSGLGVEFARALATAGADIALVARRRDRLEAVAGELRESGVRAVAVPADLAEAGACAHVVAEAERLLGPVSILVNNAGVAPMSRAEKHARDKWERALLLDLTVPFLLAQEVARRLIESGRPGRIVNVTSVLARTANPVYNAIGYVTAKAGLENATRQMATEWAKYGITVNALGPGWFQTELTEHGFAEPSNVERVLNRTPMGRLGEGSELRTALLYLVAPASSFTTGTTVFVDGGWTSW
jgi:NAD(P)-dependent dehydrogenase (short-subunit alcohol dehydrogenase family)